MSPDWLPNPGRPPVFSPSWPDEACPDDRIHEDEAQNTRVYVQLRNGRAPPYSWPIFGRPIPTRWSLTGEPFDIQTWRRA